MEEFNMQKRTTRAREAGTCIDYPIHGLQLDSRTSIRERRGGVIKGGNITIHQRKGFCKIEK